MTRSEFSVGSITRAPVGQLADKAARHLLEFKHPRALTCDDLGKVWLEPLDGIAEVDLVGVYCPKVGLLELHRRMAADLLFEKQQRGFVR